MFYSDKNSCIQSTDSYNEYSPFDKQLEVILNVTPVLMAISTIGEGRLMKVNKTWLDALEYTYSEVIGRCSRELDIFTDYSERERIGKLIQRDGVVRNEELSIRTKSGRILICLFSGDIIRVGNENYFLTTAVDITEKKKIEDSLHRMYRFNLLGQMAACISHEIRNPMNSVYGMLQLLKVKDSEGKYTKELDIMLEEILRANSTVEEFLSLGREKPVRLQKCNLNDIIQKLNPLISSDAIMNLKNAEFELGDIPELHIDEGEICQLVLNMVRNGLESMEPGKTLRIKTYYREGFVVLAIQDEGKGIARDNLSKLGTPFFTTKENGTGLGLSICFNIVERNNGYINIDSEPQGTTFYINFKIREE